MRLNREALEEVYNLKESVTCRIHFDKIEK